MEDFKIPTDLENQVDALDLANKHGLMRMLNSRMDQYYAAYLDAHTYTIDQLLELVPEKDWDKYVFNTICADEYIEYAGAVHYKRTDKESREIITNKMEELRRQLDSFPSYYGFSRYWPVLPEIIEKLTLKNIHVGLNYYQKCVNLGLGNVNMSAKFAIDHAEREIYNTTPYSYDPPRSVFVVDGKRIISNRIHRSESAVHSSEVEYRINNDVLQVSWTSDRNVPDQRSSTFYVFFDLRNNCCISEIKALKKFRKWD